MGIFGNPNPFEEALDKVTNELNTEIDWGAIISLCDKVKTTSKGPQDFTVVVLQKINHKVPHVSMQAITVLDACVNNCGKDFHKAIASQHFTESLAEIINNSSKNKKVVRRLCYFIRKWAEDFKDDPELSHFVSFYYLHRGRGIQFPDTDEDASSTSKRSTEPLSKDPNVVSSQQEEEDIAKAIEASLKEEQQKKSISNSLSGSSVQSSLYPSMLNNTTSTQSSYNTSYAASGSSSKKLVKALYDFEAAEDNELTFRAGDLISILDDRWGNTRRLFSVCKLQYIVGWREMGHQIAIYKNFYNSF
nr:signal transducing adapter molecule 1-like [Ciona intestinalis]|eukprot:XP_026691027.1 signal transducing adapter molecule 1-like [Ciona intestinalis]